MGCHNPGTVLLVLGWNVSPFRKLTIAWSVYVWSYENEFSAWVDSVEEPTCIAWRTG
jgi:hypothetical protein